jgi:hypothetical protein
MKITSLLVLTASVCGAGTFASAQAITSTVQLTNQSIQNTQGASQSQSIRIKQPGKQAGSSQQGDIQATGDVNGTMKDCHCAKQPYFSLNSADVAPGTEISIASPDPDAVIYYTTDGWTPTNASSRYIGPISVSATTRLQAIAIQPTKLPSPVAEADYIVNSAAAPLPVNVEVKDGVLAKGTVLRLVTASKATSETVNVGDPISILLDQNIVVGGDVLAERGMSVEASIAWVERAGHGGKPGMIIFKVTSCPIHGVSVPLTGILTMAAPDIGALTRRVSDPTLVKVTGPLPPGKAAEIEPGMTLTATVAADTKVHP